MVYGRSLSFCVCDIIEGKVKESDVIAMVTSTAFENKEEFEKGIESYARSYWISYPEKGKEIARKLWDSGRIEQPRLKNKNCYQDLYAFPIWAETKIEAYKSIVYD